MSFWKFLEVGAVAMPAALVAAFGGTILMNLLLTYQPSLRQLILIVQASLK